MKKIVLIALVFLLIPALCFSQNSIKAKEIIQQINDGESVNYKNVEIEGDLDFSKVDYATEKHSRGSTAVYTYHIKVPVNFKNCVFKGSVLGYIHDDWGNETHNARFHEDVSFEGCEFEEESAFKYVVFEKDASFENTKFHEEALFKYTEFSSPAKFSGSHFNADANFKYTKFPEEVSFDDVVFKRYSNFKYTKFNDRVSFKNTEFNRDADFKYTKFRDDADFDGAEFRDDVDFKYAKVNGKSLTLHLLKRR